jgi:hypothetical protein
VHIATPLLSLLGVIVGAGMTFLSGNLLERSRWLRQQGIRWDENRLDAYARYAAAVKRNCTASAQVLAGKGVLHSIGPADPGAGLQELLDAEIERATTFEAVLLLADTATIAAGSRLNRHVWRMQAFARGELPVDTERWHETSVLTDRLGSPSTLRHATAWASQRPMCRPRPRGWTRRPVTSAARCRRPRRDGVAGSSQPSSKYGLIGSCGAATQGVLPQRPGTGS